MSAHRSPGGPMPFEVGTVLAGKYRIERLLGEGGMGWVVVATHLQLEQRVALKFLHTKSLADHPDAAARFLREARAAARIQSEHVARVSDVGTLEDGAPYLVMEYLEGQDLESVMHTQPRLPEERVVDVALQACEGLAEAHAKGIVHRDLKPANLFLARRSDGSARIKLLDFGISKIMPTGSGSEAGMTSTQTLMGSPLYMSPEQLRSSKNVDHRADLWSMGIILYEMLVGKSPFDADTLPEICSRVMVEPPPAPQGVRAGLDAVILRCLEKDPRNRYADVGALALALAPFGPPGSQAIAERVARVAQTSAAHFPDPRPDASGPVPQAAVQRASATTGASQTTVAFGAGGIDLPRRSTLPLALAAAAVVAAVCGVVVFARSKPTTVPMTSTASGPAAPASASLPALPPATVLSPAPMVAATASANASAAVAAPSASPAPSAAPVRPPPKPRPPLAGTAPTVAKPASTNGFGGRD